MATYTQVQHLILIGDHQQLRPKAQNYALNVDNTTTQHNFNISMFERLVCAGSLRFGKLARQHRMRPQISRLIKPFYPELMDAAKTMNRPNIRGLQSNVVFIDHSQPEKDKSGRNRKSAGGEKVTRVNVFEVDMLCRILR